MSDVTDTEILDYIARRPKKKNQYERVFTNFEFYIRDEIDSFLKSINIHINGITNIIHQYTGLSCKACVEEFDSYKAMIDREHKENYIVLTQHHYEKEVTDIAYRSNVEHSKLLLFDLLKESKQTKYIFDIVKEALVNQMNIPCMISHNKIMEIIEVLDKGNGNFIIDFSNYYPFNKITPILNNRGMYWFEDMVKEIREQKENGRLLKEKLDKARFQRQKKLKKLRQK